MQELLWAGLIIVLATSVIAFVLALDSKSQLLDLIAYTWAGFSAAYGPVILLSLYWPGMTRVGAISGMAVGGVTPFLWKKLRKEFSIYMRFLPVSSSRCLLPY